jgi:hypothetical protein
VLVAAIGLYAALRTILAIVQNVFLPKIPMPKSMGGKIAVLAIGGLVVGLVSPLWLLAAWIGVCLLSVFTYSFA